MPIKKAAFKALRQSKKRRIQNQRIQKQLKEFEKKLRKALAEKNQEILTKLIPEIAQRFDKAARKGVIRKNTARRKKSRLMKKLRSH